MNDVVFNNVFDVALLLLTLQQRALSPEVHVKLGRRADPNLNC